MIGDFMNNKRKRNNNVFLNMNAAEAYFYTKFGESVEEEKSLFKYMPSLS